MSRFIHTEEKERVNKLVKNFIALKQKEAKISSAELARRVGITRQQYSRYQNGSACYSFLLIVKCLNALQVSFAELEVYLQPDIITQRMMK